MLMILIKSTIKKKKKKEKIMICTDQSFIINAAIFNLKNVHFKVIVINDISLFCV